MMFRSKVPDLPFPPSRTARPPWEETLRWAAPILALLLHLAVGLGLLWSSLERPSARAPSPEPPLSAPVIEASLSRPPPPPPSPPAASEEESKTPSPHPLHLSPAEMAEQRQEGAAKSTAAKATPQPRRKLADDPKAVQNVQDRLMIQVLAHWTPAQELWRQHARLSLSVDLLPNGMLGPPYAADRPFDAHAIAGYGALAADDPRRQWLRDFYQAIRAAQPFRLPKQFLALAPFTIRIDFVMDDIPRPAPPPATDLPQNEEQPPR